jgi:hypothetical protein
LPRNPHEYREVARRRHNHEQISVLPAAKGEEVIIAKRRVRVGVNDPDEHARQMELQNRVRKLAGAMVKPLDYDPGSQFLAQPEAPNAAQVIHPSEFMAAQESPEPENSVPQLQDLEPFSPEMEVSSMEWQSQGKGPRPRAWDFADLES